MWLIRSCVPCLRGFHIYFPHRRDRLHTLARPVDNSIESFRSHFFNPQLPVHFADSRFLDSIPAALRWFRPSSSSPPDDRQILDEGYLAPFGSTTIPIEITRIAAEENIVHFDRIDGPLQLFLEWSKDAADSANEHAAAVRLYIAQCLISDLPTALQEDLPTPELVRRAGKGDVYGSSVWMGVPPTYTPLHRDPNPNLFVQLAGEKRVRLFSSEVGRALYEQAQKQIGAMRGTSKLRGVEMMGGEERRVLEGMVWNDEIDETLQQSGYEVQLGRGDGLFIPKGWWHSLKGVGNGINGSVNWWFR